MNHRLISLTHSINGVGEGGCTSNNSTCFAMVWFAMVSPFTDSLITVLLLTMFGED